MNRRSIFPFGYDDRYHLYLPFYRLGAEVGSTIPDYSGQGNDGAVSGPVPGVEGGGNVQRSWYWDGSDDYVTVTNHPSLDLDHQTDFTVIVWARFPESQVDLGAVNNMVIDTYDGSTYPLRLYIGNAGAGYDGLIVLRRNDGTTSPLAASTTRIDDDTWHLFIGKRVDGNLYASLDAVNEGGPTTDVANDPTNALDLNIGRDETLGGRYIKMNLGLLAIIKGYGMSDAEELGVFERTRWIFGV